MSYEYFTRPDIVRGFVMSFVEARCAVSSQHKLPSDDEILNSEMARFLGRDVVQLAVTQLIHSGRLLRYGPYLSDHEIDVL